MDETAGRFDFGFKASLFPSHDIGQADVADATPSLEREFSRPHRVQDGLASHPLHLPHLLHRQPPRQHCFGRWDGKASRPRGVCRCWRHVAIGLVGWPDSNRRFLNCLFLRLFQHVSPSTISRDRLPSCEVSSTVAEIAFDCNSTSASTAACLRNTFAVPAANGRIGNEAIRPASRPGCGRYLSISAC